MRSRLQLGEAVPGYHDPVHFQGWDGVVMGLPRLPSNQDGLHGVLRSTFLRRMWGSRLTKGVGYRVQYDPHMGNVLACPTPMSGVLVSG